MGCDDLMVVTDHKPLTKLLSDRTLDEIPNTRLFPLKQRTLPSYFQIVHLLGRSNNAVDATSRHPSPNGTINHLGSPDLAESALMAFIKTNTSALSLSWDVIAKHTASHPDMQMLLSCIHSGFQENHRLDPAIKPYWQYRHGLYEPDGVLLYDDRVVIPPNLRSSVLQTLHSAHPGVSSMTASVTLLLNLISPQLHRPSPLHHSSPLPQTSFNYQVTTTSSWLTNYLVGLKYAKAHQDRLSQADMASSAVSSITLHALVYQKSYPAMEDQS